MASDRGVEVQIFGRIYHLRGDNSKHTREVARLVDERMNHIADRVQTADSYRVAVLTALHIADQLLSEKSDLASYRSRVDETSVRMLKLLDPDQVPEQAELAVSEAKGWAMLEPVE